MRRFGLGLALGAALALGGTFGGPVAAEPPPGRSASTAGLANAFGKVSMQDFHFVTKPMASISLNIVSANDPDQPGVRPGGGVVEP